MQCDACKVTEQELHGGLITHDPVLKMDLCPGCHEAQREHADFTHPYRRTETKPVGIHYDPFFTPQKCAGLLCKVAFKSKFKPGAKVKGGKSGGRVGKVMARGKK